MAEKNHQRADRSARLAKDEAELVAEIRSRGYDIDSVWDLVNNSPHPHLKMRFLGPYRKAYPILVKHLAISHDPCVREGIIRALTERDVGPVASEALLREFYKATDKSLRWVLANALRVVLTKSEKKKHPEYKEVYIGKRM
jgi:hypothetical protein